MLKRLWRGLIRAQLVSVVKTIGRLLAWQAKLLEEGKPVIFTEQGMVSLTEAVAVCQSALDANDS